MPYEPSTFYGLLGLVVINISAIVISFLKERTRKKSQEKNGEAIIEVRKLSKNIDSKVDALNINMAKLTTEVKAVKNNCKLTTSRFEKAIETNRRDILEVVKVKRG